MKHALALVALVATLVSGPGSVYRLAVQVTHCPKPACTRVGPGTHQYRQRPVLDKTFDAHAAGVITGQAMVRLADAVR